MDSTERRSFGEQAARPPNGGSKKSNRTLAARILVAIGLLYIFLLSIEMMGCGFKLFGGKFADALMQGCSDPVVGLFIGILATGLIQSSSTTTSLIVGFVGGGVLTFELAIPMLMGANVGTTITNILVSFGFVTRKEDFRRAFAGATVHDFFNLCSVAVLFPIEIRFHIIRNMALYLGEMFRHVGGVEFASPLKTAIKPVSNMILMLLKDVLGLGNMTTGILLVCISLCALFFALIFLVKTLRALIVERAEQFINRYLFRNDFTAILLGVALTVAVQSSSVTTSLVVPLVAAGVVTLRQCYPFTLGANVGTTCTALLASLATVTAAENGMVGVDTAFAHLLFNLLGIAIFYPLKAIPIWLAERLADLAAESKRWAVVFVLAVFFGFPLLIILLS